MFYHASCGARCNLESAVVVWLKAPGSEKADWCIISVLFVLPVVPVRPLQVCLALMGASALAHTYFRMRRIGGSLMSTTETLENFRWCSSDTGRLYRLSTSGGAHHLRTTGLYIGVQKSEHTPFYNPTVTVSTLQHSGESPPCTTNASPCSLHCLHTNHLPHTDCSRF